MSVFERTVDRPLPVFLAAGLVILFGFWSLSKLPVKRNPEVQIPVSVVLVEHPGATPGEVESEVTIELEEELTTLDGLRHLSSVSTEGVSSHVIEFEDRVDMTESLRDVQDKVELAKVNFPDAAKAPVVREVSFDDQPIVFFTLRAGRELDLHELHDIAEALRPQLESVPGVGEVDVFGGYEREVHVLADPIVLAANALTLEDLGRALQLHGQSSPGGKVRAAAGEWLIRPNGEYTTVEEIRAVVVRREPLGALAVGDVARVELGQKRLRSGAWIDAEPSVTLIVRPRTKVDTIETVDLLTRRVDELRERLPRGVSIQATSDRSRDIESMLRQLGTSAALGAILVVAVLLVMFGPAQALLVASALPFSLLFTFIGLFVFGMEISNIALFSLILVLGLVVDGAIVVGEAIYAEREAGARSRSAAKVGVARVGLPVISADLTTIAAFLPMLLMVGVMGQFMSVMPKVVAFALVGSVFVDHFLLPAAVAKIGLPRRRTRRKILAPDGLPWFSPELPRMKRLYMNVLGAALRHRSLVVGVAAVCLAGAFLLFSTGAIDSIFLPKTDRGRFTINYSLPLGTSLAETSRVGLLIADEVLEIPEVDNCVLTTGDTGALSADNREGGRLGLEYGRLTVELVNRPQRVRSQSEIVAKLRSQINHYAGVEIDLKELSEGPPTGAALAVRVRGEDLDILTSAADAILGRIKTLGAAEDVRVDYDRGKPEVRVDLDRTRAADSFGVVPASVWRALRLAFQGEEVARMWLGSERVDIRVEALSSFTQTVERVKELPLRSESGRLFPLGEIAQVSVGFSHDAIFRHDTLRTITVRANAASGASSVALEADARAAIGSLELAGVQVEFGGESEERDRSYASLWQALKWGLLLIYVIIAAQFDSLRQPLVVILAIPLALVGVALGLVATGTPFSFIVFIGAVSLTGIVVNSGIVLVDAINQNRRDGMPMRNAICDGALSRLRPVLLTTLTTVAGLLPLTLNIADGAEFWVPLGVTIISGLCASTVLTLFVVPVLYSLLEGPPLGWQRVRSRNREFPVGATLPARTGPAGA